MISIHPALKRAAAIAGAPSPAKPVQGRTGNGPLANPISVSTTGAGVLNTGAGTGVIGARLPQGGTTAMQAPNAQQAGADPAELDKARLEAQNAQLQAQQAKAQAAMSKLEATHQNRMQSTAGSSMAGYVGKGLQSLNSRMQRLLTQVNRHSLRMPKVAAENTAAPAALPRKPMTTTRSGAPLPQGFKPPPAGGSRPLVAVPNTPAGITGADISRTWNDYAKPLLRGEKEMTEENVPLAPSWMTPEKDTSLARGSGAWLVNRAGHFGSKFVGNTVRGVGGHGIKTVAGLGEGLYNLVTSPVESARDIWNKPLSESKVLAPMGRGLVNAAGLAVDAWSPAKLPGAGLLLSGLLGGSTPDEAPQAAQAAVIEQAAKQQNPQASVDGNAVLEWLQRMGAQVAPYLDTSWLRRGGPEDNSTYLPSVVGGRGHSVRDATNYLR